jgi:dihydroorotate dehydrogenase electron transfer subunit
MVRVGTGMDPLLRRPFSVHQTAEEGLLQILFKIVGRGTQALAAMGEGEIIDVLGPLGRGFDCANKQAHYLVGGGIGTAPLLFLARQLLSENDPATIRVLLGARTGEEISVLAEDFSRMGIAVETATEDGSLGCRGLVTDLMIPVEKNIPVTVYGCGPYPMLRAVAAICRERDWACQVSLETIMACGLGACLGCTVMRADMKGYLHVCKDGPVLDVDDVAWL